MLIQRVPPVLGVVIGGAFAESRGSTLLDFLLLLRHLVGCVFVGADFKFDRELNVLHLQRHESPSSQCLVGR